MLVALAFFESESGCLSIFLSTHESYFCSFFSHLMASCLPSLLPPFLPAHNTLRRPEEQKNTAYEQSNEIITISRRTGNAALIDASRVHFSDFLIRDSTPASLRSTNVICSALSLSLCLPLGSPRRLSITPPFVLPTFWCGGPGDENADVDWNVPNTFFFCKGRDLPAADPNGLMDPYLIIQCQGEKFNTETFMYLGKAVHRRRETVDPMWYLTWEADLSMPPEDLQGYFSQVRGKRVSTITRGGLRSLGRRRNEAAGGDLAFRFAAEESGAEGGTLQRLPYYFEFVLLWPIEHVLVKSVHLPRVGRT